MIDYRGWGESDAPWVRDESAPAGSDARREVREVVHPLDQATDLLSAVHWAMGEPMVDAGRVDLWGTSFSGGLVVYVAVRHPRAIRASRRASARSPGSASHATGWRPMRWPARSRPRDAAHAARSAIRRLARARSATCSAGRWRKGSCVTPIDDIPAIAGCAVLIIDVENEELFDTCTQGELAYQRAAEPKTRW